MSVAHADQFIGLYITCLISWRGIQPWKFCLYPLLQRSCTSLGIFHRLTETWSCHPLLCWLQVCQGIFVMLNLETSAFAVWWLHLSISCFTVYGVSYLSSVPFAGISSVFLPSGFLSVVRTIFLVCMPCDGVSFFPLLVEMSFWVCYWFLFSVFGSFAIILHESHSQKLCNLNTIGVSIYSHFKA